MGFRDNWGCCVLALIGKWRFYKSPCSSSDCNKISLPVWQSDSVGFQCHQDFHIPFLYSNRGLSLNGSPCLVPCKKFHQ